MILVDATNLGHICFHAMGDLSYDEEPVGVIYGFLRKVLSMASDLDSTNFVFCWDSRKSLRRKLYPDYKSNRQELSEEEARQRKVMYKQFTALRQDILPRMGFNNNLMSVGFEADDIIAECCISTDGMVAIVSTDKDLYQLLDSSTFIYKPTTGRVYTDLNFDAEFDMTPSRWVDIKAVMGDVSDNIKGIDGVGIKTALKYFRGELKNGKKKSDIDANNDLIELNKKLIELPLVYRGRRPKVDLVDNTFNREEFINVFDKFRFLSFLKDEGFSKWERTFNLKEE